MQGICIPAEYLCTIYADDDDDDDIIGRYERTVKEAYIKLKKAA
jgi:hypothetical protein